MKRLAALVIFFFVSVLVFTQHAAEAGPYACAPDGYLHVGGAGGPIYIDPDGNLVPCDYVPSGGGPSAPTLSATAAYLVATTDISYSDGSSLPLDGSTINVNISNFKYVPDYVVAYGEAQIGNGSACTALSVNLNGVFGGFTGTDPGNQGDCAREGTTQNRTYATASVTAAIASGQTSIPIQVTLVQGGPVPGQSNAFLRLVRMNFYRYNFPGGDGQNKATIVAPTSFNGLVATQSQAIGLFGGIYCNADNNLLFLALNGSPPPNVNGASVSSVTGTLPTSGTRRAYFYLPPNSVYQSAMGYWNGTASLVTVRGIPAGGSVAANYPSASNPIDFQALNLGSVSNLSGYLVAYPKTPALVAKPQATTAPVNSNVAVDVSMSGLDPASLTVSVNKGAATPYVVAGGTLWTQLRDNGKSTLSIPVTGSTGLSIPITIKGKAVETGQVLTQQFVITLL
jgi:hypothetical protein